MTQTVRFVDSTSYSDEDIAEVFASLYGTSFVIPYGDDLSCVSSGAGDASIIIGTGRAQVLGALYESTADETITLDAQGGGDNRIDRIVLRRSVAGQTVRLTVIKGTADTFPLPPALTAEDMPLWKVYVPDGFGAASTVNDYDILDERVFGSVAKIHDRAALRNLALNSEYMAYSVPAAGTHPPDYWDMSIPTGSIVATAKLGTDPPRGQAFDADLPNGEWVAYNFFPPYLDKEDNTATTFTVAFQYYVVEDFDPIDVQIMTYPGPVTQVQRRLYPDENTYDYVERLTLDLTSVTSVQLLIISNAGDGEIVVNPMLITAGYMPGPYRKTHEILMFTHAALTDAAWADTAKGAGTTTIDLDANFSGYVPKGALVALGRVRSRDTASSAAASAGVKVYSYQSDGVAGHVSNAGYVNNAKKEQPFYAGIRGDSQTFDVEAIPAGTLNVTLLLTGLVI